ncbi:MAG: MBL fold metallo-hydrolase [Novosphingobium sp.]|nr:MBL fold metallo-hydrolase [Novosphingobium sp.]
MADDTLSLTFHGAAHTVTGSCMQFTCGGKSVLVDCGMFQGSRTLEKLNAQPFTFDPKQIDAVVLTHAHIDHSGMLPKLVKHGYRGPIWCTQPTADLLQYMLADSGRIQESEAERHNRRRDRREDDAFEPVYTEQDAITAWRQCKGIDREVAFQPAPGFNVRLWNAGHVLGSASVELQAGGVRVMCSGDLGPEHNAFLPDPNGPSGFDYVVCESTYGSRVRDEVTLEQRRALLGAEVQAAISRGGNLVIPTFALERTQELLLDLDYLLRNDQIPHTPVFIDSPLASEITSVFASYSDKLEDTGGANIFAHPAFHFVQDVQESIRVNSVTGAIILAASGMCEGGRIRHHLLHNLNRRNSTVLFVGFQAMGTLGRVILDGAKNVRISGRDVEVRAQIRRIDSYSAHADQAGLLKWIDNRGPIASSLFLSHGEPDSLETLRRELQARAPGLSVKLPEIGETYALAPGKPAKRTATGRTDLSAAAGHDWQNTYADFTSSLRTRLTKIRDEHQRQKALEEMRRVLDSYADFKQARGK